MSIQLDSYPKYWSKKGEEINLSYERAKKYIKFLRGFKGYVAFDTETTSLAKKYNKLVSIQFSTDDKTGYVICLDSPYTNYTPDEAKDIKLRLKDLFEDTTTKIIWIGHNIQFDNAQVLNQLKVKIIAKPIYDTQIFIHILDENRIAIGKYSPLKSDPIKNTIGVCEEFFNYKEYEQEAVEARHKGSLLDLDIKHFVTYSGMDAYVTYRVFMYLKKYAESIGYWTKAQKLLNYLLSGALKMFSQVSTNGFYVDKKHLMYLLSEDSVIVHRLEEIKQAYKNDAVVKRVNEYIYNRTNNNIKSTFNMSTPWIFDINKQKHKRELFFNCPCGFKLKSDNESTDSFFQKQNKDNRIVKLYSEEQGLKKLLTSYLNPIWDILSVSDDSKDSRVRANFRLNGTVTGRCLRKGTYIDTVRDISKYPKGKKIEDVVPGDLVYCYDKNCKPVIKKVLWAGKTGHKELIRISWLGSGRHTKGYVDITPDHKVRLSSGEYIRADKLKYGDSILSLSRNNHMVTDVKRLNISDDVYDIEVEGVHNFIANGLCVHNCSSNCPNLQQIPRSDSWEKKQIKCLYAAEPSGDKNDPNVLIQADFCANEIRFWGAISSDPNLCKSFDTSFKKGAEFRANPTDEKLEEEAHLLGDIHKQTASQMYDVPIKEVTSGLRQDAKSLSLGIMFQRGVKSVASQLNITEEETEKKFEKFFSKYEVGVEWSNKMKKLVNEQGFVESPLGRRRHLNDEIKMGKKLLNKAKEFPRGDSRGKELWRKGNSFISRAERQAVNSPIQGLASDMALIACSLLHRYIIKHNKKWKIVNSVHDSVVIEMRMSEVLKASRVIRKMFTINNRKYALKYFGWKMPTHVDIDFELSQGKAWKCKKCGSIVNYWKKSCDAKDKDGKVCGCTNLKLYKLNHGYGTLVNWNETELDFNKIKQGF